VASKKVNDPLGPAAISRRLAAARPARDPRERLRASIEGTISPELHALIEAPVRAASVLLTLLERPGGHTVLLTERAAHLKDHAGQISFPGGRVAVGETPTDAALREAFEEVGLLPASVHVLGALDVFVTGTGFSITPIVGLVAGDTFAATPDPHEVATVFEMPLELVLGSPGLAVAYRERLGARWRGYELHYSGHRIWGATAAILQNFREVILDEKTTR
jgi:8-oxo-dGTP pyrophosphatase MutT (NUDIX family)